MSGWRSLARITARTTAAARAGLRRRRAPPRRPSRSAGPSRCPPAASVPRPPSPLRSRVRRRRRRSPSRHACRDKIHMRGMTPRLPRRAPRGNTLGQKVVVDVTMSACHLKAGASDNIEHRRLRRLRHRTAESAERENAKLIERVGERRALLDRFPPSRTSPSPSPNRTSPSSASSNPGREIYRGERHESAGR